MLLCYIDESGNTGGNLKDALQPLLLLTALLIPPEKIKAVEDELRALGYRHFQAESRNTDFEFHGDDIYNARGRYFKKLPLEKRLTIFDELVAVVIKNTDIQLGYVAIDKVKYYGKVHIQQAAFSLLVERLEERLKQRDEYCLLVADEQDELEQRLIDDLDHFKQHGTHFGYKNVRVERIIDSVHFVESKNNYLMQLTDVLCYLIRKGKEAKNMTVSEFLAQTPRQGTYNEFLDAYPNKGKRYFARMYDTIGSKVWDFAKDFPT